MRSFDPALIALSPRPWLSRRQGECAFPVDGEGHTVRSCCNPCGPGAYCPAHQAAMRGPAISSAARFAVAVLAWLEGAP